MNVPSLSFYDPDQVAIPDESGDYQQWVQNYYAQNGQFVALQPEAQPAAMSQMTYDAPVHVQHPPAIPASIPASIPSSNGMQQPQMQNQYHFVQSQYMAPQHQRPNPMFNQVYPQGRPVDRPTAIPPRISRPMARQSNVVPTGYVAASHHQPVPQQAAISMSYQQPQHQGQYRQPSQQDSVPSVSYYQTMPPSELVAAPDARTSPQNQEFTFQYQTGTDPRHTPASGASFTPNSDTHPLPSASPASWTGTDESTGQTFVAQQTTGQNGPSSPPPSRRATLPSGKSRGKKRARIVPTADDPDSGSDDEDGQGHSSMAVPPLRGPDTNASRL